MADDYERTVTEVRGLTAGNDWPITLSCGHKSLRDQKMEVGEKTECSTCEHYDKPESGSQYYSSIKGRIVRAYDGFDYTITGHHDCGYHLKPVAEGKGEQKCISERAIGRTFHLKGDGMGWNTKVEYP